jgi:hypothetical protein
VERPRSRKSPPRVRRVVEMTDLLALSPSGGSFTLRFLGGGLAVLAIVAIVARWRGRRRIAIAAGAGMLAIAVGWCGLQIWKPRWLRLALADPRGVPDTTTTVSWIERAPGLETADLPVVFHGETVDSIALVRLDSAHYQLSVHWDPEPHTIDDWQRRLDAAVVINGSYFEPDDTPSTPIRSDHRALGPRDYVSTHGAFVVGPWPDIVDLRGASVDATLPGYRDAMVSYPLLVDPRGPTRASGHDDWFANRVFVGIDTLGRVVIGTTRTGFFSLRRLADFLAASPLELQAALNLDGGPIASQIVTTPEFHRTVRGNAEITGGGDVLRLAYQSIQASRAVEVKLPIVLAARPR